MKLGESGERRFRLDRETLLRRLEQQYHSPILLVGIEPAGFEFAPRVSGQARSRVGEIHDVSANAMDEDEMAVRPECYARKQCLLFEVIERYLHRQRAEAKRFRCARDARQRRPLTILPAQAPDELF